MCLRNPPFFLRDETRMKFCDDPGQEPRAGEGGAPKADAVPHAHQPGPAGVLPPHERHAPGGAQHGARVDGAAPAGDVQALPAVH